MRLALLIAVCVVGCAPMVAAPIEERQAPGHVLAAKRLEQMTVALVGDVSDAAYCSGVWISDREILTAQHCVDDVRPGGSVFYVVRDDVFGSGTEAKEKVKGREAKVVTKDEEHDLALLQTSGAPAHIAATLSPYVVQQGQFAQTMGQSLGFLWWTYSSGDVSAIRTLDTGNGNTKWVQTTTPISPGNSGGGLFDTYGELIGICHGHFTKGDALNLFVHRDHVAEFLKRVGK